MDEREHAIAFAARILAAADSLEPDGPKHLVITTGELRTLLELGQVPADTIDEVMHHAFHVHAAEKIAFLSDAWRPAPRCLECGGRALPIVYGMPPAALGALSDLGVQLAGCVRAEYEPSYACSQCDHTW